MKKSSFSGSDRTLPYRESPTTTVAKHMREVTVVANAIDDGMVDKKVSMEPYIYDIADKQEDISKVSAASLEVVKLADQTDNIQYVIDNISSILQCSNEMSTLLVLHQNILDLIKLADNVDAVVDINTNLRVLEEVRAAMHIIATVHNHLTCIHWNYDNQDLLNWPSYLILNLHMPHQLWFRVMYLQ